MNEEINPENVRIHSRADELIACLEGEIAKRDEVIVGLTNSRDFWREKAIAADDKLAAIKAQEPVGYVVEKKTGSLTALIGVIRASAILEDFVTDGTPLYAAPVSEAKAQGVVLPERKQYHDYLSLYDKGEAIGHNNALSEVARLNAAPAQQVKCKTCDDNGMIGGPSFYSPDEGGEPCPDCCSPVQQVSVPASAFASRAITHYEAALLAAFPSGSSGEVFNQWNEARRVLASSPAAPAADAGHVFYGMDGNHP